MPNMVQLESVRAPASAQAYWAMETAELLTALGSSVRGLRQEEAERRLLTHGENRPRDGESVGVVRLLLRQYSSPLVLILIFGAVVSLLLQQWTDAIIILLIVLGSTILGFTQEYRATRVIKRLRDRLALAASVLRDGESRDIDARKVVPGDVILLSAGDLVPADGVILSARDFLISQAALTGESFPVEKSPGRAPETAPLIERSNVVFLGTSVRSGTASVLITRTGQATELAAVASGLTNDEETDFERGIRRFGYLLARIMIVIVIFVFTTNLLFGRELIDSLLFSVALAVGLTPELLPAIVSVTLSNGARRMAKRGVIVRRLDAIENLGTIDVLCTDKTGTLTRGVIELSAAVDADGMASEQVFRCAAMNSRLETGIDNPIDEAIVREAERRNLATAVAKIDEIPYDFLRKRLTIVVDTGADAGTHLIVTKGAFDSVLDCCSQVCGPAGPVALDEQLKAKLVTYYRERGAQGFRVLGLAVRRIPARPHYGRDDERDMEFAGFLLFLDPLKEGIAKTIGELSALGITTKIISGDNRYVAAHIGAAIGIDSSRMLTGRQLNETRDEALWHLAEQTDIFAEVDPQQKERIVRALQRRGHAVAYLGDGINDAPALHAADVGISVDQAVDVARESADVVLTQRDLEVLKGGVVDGRRTFANTLKYIAITTSANFGNMISMALAALFIPFLPLVAKQILLNNFLSDFPSIAISTDNVDIGATESAQHWDIRGIQSFTLVFGLISTVFDLVTFVMLLGVFRASEALFQSTWFMISLLTELVVVLILRTRAACWSSRPSSVLVISTVVVAGLAVLLPYTDGIARAFGFVAVPFHLVVFAVAIVILYSLATEAAKRLYYATARR